MRSKPELLAPAGSMAALIAAVQNGADAVYLGMGDFNARHSAGNFSAGQLAEAVRYCHARGVRVHVTLNTMIREDELPALRRAIESVAASGADAALVQDFGVARAVRAVAPGLALHASTQMAAHNRAGVEFLARNGFARAVLAREMSLPEIQACADLGIELEAFVHGALCVSCSGQCLFSGMVGGRSGNRGRCAQPCRMRYRMEDADGYLLSTKDLCALGALDDLREAGVDSFKIEGRLKRPEYVAAVTAAYRAAIDQPAAPRDALPLQQMFNRGGFTQGYLHGVDDSELMFSARPNHLGVKIGGAAQDGWIRLDADVDPEDALVLRAIPLGEPETAAPGAADGKAAARRRGEHRSRPVAQDPHGKAASSDADRPVRLSGFAGDSVRCPGARRGDRLIRLVSEAQMRAARESASVERRAISIRAELTLRVGRPAELGISDGTLAAQAVGPAVEAAHSREFDRERAEAQLRKTGGTPYRMTDVAIHADANAFFPISELNALRRNALDALTQLRLSEPSDAAATASRASGSSPAPADFRPSESICAAALRTGSDFAMAQELLPPNADAVPPAHGSFVEGKVSPARGGSAEGTASSAHGGPAEDEVLPAHSGFAESADGLAQGAVSFLPRASGISDDCATDQRLLSPNACAEKTAHGGPAEDEVLPAHSGFAESADGLAQGAASFLPRVSGASASRAPTPTPAHPAVRVQSGNPELLRRALALGADGAIFDPPDVRPEALDAFATQLPDTFALAVPEVLSQRSLEALFGWAQRHAGRIERVYLANIGHFALDWPGVHIADFLLNAANSLAVSQLRDWGCAGYTPSVELNGAQITAMDSEESRCPRELIVHGRIPLMRLRHCPLRAARGISGKHAGCHRCDGCAPAERVDAKSLTDRTGASFPLRRLATPDGCVIRLLNSVPLMTLRKIRRLPRAESWRVLADGAGDTEAAIRLYLLAARGEDVRQSPDWPALSEMPSTTGHYFRGVE